MKNTVLFLFLLSFVFQIHAQQISLFNKHGHAVAYIDYDEDATIYTWDGYPLAFLKKEGTIHALFGFNGKFLAWYKQGRVHDKKGYILAAEKSKMNRATRGEGIKSMQKLQAIRSITELAPIRPIFKSTWSEEDFIKILEKGKK